MTYTVSGGALNSTQTKPNQTKVSILASADVNAMVCKQVYMASLGGRILITARNSSARHGSTVQLTDGQRLVKLHYRRRRHRLEVPSTPACDSIGRRTEVARFLREFLPSSTALGLPDSLCVNRADHVRELRDRAVDLAEWDVRAINLHVLSDDARRSCAGDDQMLDAFMQKLGNSKTF